MSIEIVDTIKGKLRGKQCNEYSVFKGIPYAMPPILERRFKYPEEMVKWEGIREATEFPKICPQMPFEEGSFYWKEFYQQDKIPQMTSEDCLYLNVWTPAERETEKLPVVVWIHGGAFTHGYGHEIEFDGEAFCKKGVILVTFNYRLGVFGYLSHFWLEKESGYSGNYGLMDQIAALRWVKDNIEAFGGDSNNITLMGQSAGAFSVEAIITSPLTKGLFQKAIMHSGIGIEKDSDIVWSQKKGLDEGDRFVKEQGVLSLSELRDISAEELLNRSSPYQFNMVVDNRILTDYPAKIIKAGKHHNIPYLMGSNKQDLWIDEEMIKRDEHGVLYQACIDVAQAGMKHNMKPSYLYYFVHELPGDDTGAFHSSELWYVFGTLNRCWRDFKPEDYALSEKMVEYWTGFMKTSKPEGSGLEEWEPYTLETKYIEQFE